MERINEIKQTIEKFSKNENEKEFIINYELSSKDREIIHKFTEAYQGLISKSHIIPEKNNNKYITISRINKDNKIIEIDTNLIQFFSRWTRIPISIPKNQYLEYNLKTMDKYFNTLYQWGIFNEYYTKFNTYSQMREDLLGIRTKIINHIKNHDETEKFIDAEYEFPKIKFGNDIYTVANKNKWLLSVDIKSANFTILNHYHPGIFDASTWIEFVKKFTDSDFIIYSKQFREEIFGETGLTKKILNICYIFVDQIMKFIKSNVDENMKVLVVSHDEVIYEINENFNIDNFTKILSKNDFFDKNFHVNKFLLKQLGTRDIFVKEGTKKEFRKASNKHILQCIKFYEGAECTANDLKFMDNDIVATYEHNIFSVSQ